MVVLTGGESAILLYQEERGSLGGFGWSDLPRVKVFVDKLIGSFLFFD